VNQFYRREWPDIGSVRAGKIGSPVRDLSLETGPTPPEFDPTMKRRNIKKVLRPQSTGGDTKSIRAQSTGGIYIFRKITANAYNITPRYATLSENKRDGLNCKR
jgi:hypothetical protein